MGCCGSTPSRGTQESYRRTTATLKDLRATYNIDKNLLGKGSFGMVYKGENKLNTSFKLAIKAIDKRKLTKQEIDDIHQEVKTIQQVDHANIVNYYETYEDERFVYLCMELCTGGELIEEGTSKKQKFDEKYGADIMMQLLSALNHVHSQGIIHRDIKPENVMFDKPNGIVKFIDFGLACQMSKGEKELAGTPYFIAPEVLTGFYDKECDIWSLGVVLYQLMSGNLPFTGTTQETLFKAIKLKSFPMPDHFSADLKDLLTQMLEKDPKRRITAIDAMNHNWFKNIHLLPEVDAKMHEEIFNRLVSFQGRSKLKRAAINMMVKEMTEDTFTQLRTVFNEIDKDQSGTIDRSELEKALHTQNPKLAHLTQEQIQEILKQVDNNNNNVINYTEFIAATINPDLLNDEDRLKGLFNQFDVDNSGQISIQEMVQAFSKFGRNITIQDCQDAMAAHDRNKDGLLSYEGFKNMILVDYADKLSGPMKVNN